jgi:hypothetical protein
MDDSRLLQRVRESAWGPADVDGQRVVWEPPPWRRAWKKAGLERSLAVLEELAAAVAQKGLTRRLVRDFGQDPERLLVAAMAWGFGSRVAQSADCACGPRAPSTASSWLGWQRDLCGEAHRRSWDLVCFVPPERTCNLFDPRAGGSPCHSVVRLLSEDPDEGLGFGPSRAPPVRVPWNLRHRASLGDPHVIPGDGRRRAIASCHRARDGPPE